MDHYLIDTAAGCAWTLGTEGELLSAPLRTDGTVDWDALVMVDMFRADDTRRALAAMKMLVTPVGEEDE